jgi:hypothetical protein
VGVGKIVTKTRANKASSKAKFRNFTKSSVFVLLAMSFLIISCSNKPCKEVSTENVPEQFLNKKSQNVFVYKYDGTRQCGQGQEVTLDAMSRQLREVKIISMSKKNDGVMRIQVCGAPTGNANVFEILSQDQSKVLKYGFQIWKFK